MKIGFSGTRNGMSDERILHDEVSQRENCFSILASLIHASADEIHHGDCLGADYQVHQFALSRPIRIVVHPPIAKVFRAYCGPRVMTGITDPVIIRVPKSYLARNRDIIEETDVLVAAPATEEEKGGTWFTINFARRMRHHIFIVMPDGHVREENQ